GNMTYNGNTLTEVQSNASLKASGDLNVLARVTKLDLEITSTSTAKALGANSEAHATISRSNGDPTSLPKVILRAGSDLVSNNAMTVKASHESVTSTSDATATTHGLGASTNSYASNDFDVETRILTEAASELHARSIEVDANASTAPNG